MILIDIEMPENCSECPCMYDCVRCQVAERQLDFETFTEKRPEWCPLKPAATPDDPRTAAFMKKLIEAWYEEFERRMKHEN